MPKKFTLTTSDGLQLNGACFSPPGEIKDVIVLIHGMGEHLGRYKHVIDFFMSIGYAVVGMDYRGHGTSQGKRGHIPSYKQLMDDTDLLVKKADELFNGLPLTEGNCPFAVPLTVPMLILLRLMVFTKQRIVTLHWPWEIYYSLPRFWNVNR